MFQISGLGFPQVSLAANTCLSGTPRDHRFTTHGGLMRDRIIISALITALLIGAGYVLFSYRAVMAEVQGELCPEITLEQASAAGIDFEERRRTDQRLDLDYDLRRALNGPALSCVTIFGQSRCETTGPALLAGQLGYRGPVTIYAIPKGETAVVRAHSGMLLCIMPGT